METKSRERSGERISPIIRFIDQLLSRSQPERVIGLLLGQLDTFNRIATTFGNAATLGFCTDYADRLRALLPPGTPIIRVSERGFAILLTADSESEVAAAARMITEEPPYMQVGDDSLLVDSILGVAMYPAHAKDAASLFRRAELALKHAREGDLGYEIYQPDSTKQQATLWKLESDLKQAIMAGDLHVFYQPKLDLQERKITGVEALVRWTTVSGRVMSPEDFIPLAERTGTIVSLTWLVFEKVLEAVRSWKRFSWPFSIAINIAPRTAAHPEFLDRLKTLRDQLAEFNVGVTVELTEDSLLKDESLSLSNLHKLRALDVDLAIDDFGKGYSSLTYLKHVPATEIKIDKTFIETISIDSVDKHIVKTVIELAHALDMRVVAEGVDSDESLAVVADLGCELVQGYLIARPMRSALIVDWLASQPTSRLMNTPAMLASYRPRPGASRIALE